MQIEGAKKLHLRSKPLNVEDRALMSRVQIHALVKYNDAMGLVDISVLVLACWYFLFRVQSEALPLECGAPQELVALPTGRPSAVWVSADTVFVRLRRRKHKPTGSVLKRACMCASTSSQFCIVRLLQKFLAGCAPGTKLWHVSASQFSRQFRAQSGTIGHLRAQEVTLRAFRRSMATQLAKDGRKLEAIFAAGEWQGAAVLHYMKSKDVDEAQLLAQAMAASESEGESEQIE